MERLAIKIVKTLYPYDNKVVGYVNKHYERMLKTLLELEDWALIAMYDAIVHKHIERK